MNAIILCGGLSTRLGEITKSIPKVLLEIKGKTVLEWQLEKLKKAGVNEAVLAAGHLANVLRQEVGEERGGVKIIYAVEPERLGTGGAIKFAWQFLAHPQEPTIVLNGDILTSVHIADMIKFLKPQSDGIILGSLVSDAASYGTLEYNKDYRLLKFKEKAGVHQSGFINGGFYIFNPHIAKHFPATHVFSIEYDVFPKMEELDVYESDKPWVDIGVPERLEWARTHWGE
jgi:D-glycero-alpha-D-manno-heptose 1-phosphate guanylyltransferase